MKINELRPENLHIQLFQYGACEFSQNGWVHKKRAPCTIIAQALKGEYEIKTPRGQGRTGEGGFFLAKAGEELTIVHHAKSKTEKMAAHWLHIDYQFINGLDPVFFLKLPVIVKGSQAISFAKELKKIESLTQKNSFENLVGKISVGFSFLSLLESVSSKNELLSDQLMNDGRLEKVFHFIDNNLEKEIAPMELAKLAHLSLSHFHALFQNLVGQTPMAYIKKMRINKAQKYLVSTSAPIKEVASKLGFKNAYHFSREFSKELGVPPSEYRETHTG
jgi:AraC-like DNA-binding protein